MNYQKGFVMPLLLVIVAGLLVGGGVYVFQQNTMPAVESQPVTSEQNQTANQKGVDTAAGTKTTTQANPLVAQQTQTTPVSAPLITYVGKVIEYSIKYPDTWILDRYVYTPYNIALRSKESVSAFPKSSSVPPIGEAIIYMEFVGQSISEISSEIPKDILLSQSSVTIGGLAATQYVLIDQKTNRRLTMTLAEYTAPGASTPGTLDITLVQHANTDSVTTSKQIKVYADILASLKLPK